MGNNTIVSLVVMLFSFMVLAVVFGVEEESNIESEKLCEVTLQHLPETQQDGSVEFIRKTVTVACKDTETIQELDEWNGEAWSAVDSLEEWQERNCK